MYIEDPDLFQLLSYDIKDNRIIFNFDIFEKIIIPLEKIWKIEIVHNPENSIPLWRIHYLGKQNKGIELPIEPELQNEE